MTPLPEDTAPPLRLGTRGSALALAQARSVAARIASRCPGVHTETVAIATQGDIDKVSPLTEIGGRGVFTNALERELAHGQIDAAVHSAKDLPSQVSVDLPIVAFPEREDPRDVLVSRHRLPLSQLPPHPVVGTSSRRREAQVRRLRPDARIVSLRGNIDTRLRKAASADYDAIVLAAAGLRRMGWCERVTEYFPTDVVVPSPGQGALAVQTTAHSSARDLIASLDDPAVSGPVLAERAFLAAIGAGCTMPVGAHVADTGAELCLIAFLEDETGTRVARRNLSLDAADPALHAAEVARGMRAEVGFHVPAVWSASPPAAQALAGLRIAVTRPRLQSAQLMHELTRHGATPLALPTIRIEPPQDRTPLESALRALAAGAFTWVVFTSANAVDAVVNTATELGACEQCLRSMRAAAVGEVTARVATEIGLDVAVVAEEPTAEGLVAALLPRIQAGERVLYPRSAIGREVLPVALREAAIDITVVDAYCTVPEDGIAPDVLAHLRDGNVDALFFSSPSSVSGLRALLGEERHLVETVPAVCAGPVTAAAVREAGLPVAAVSAQPGAAAMVEAMIEYWSERQSSQVGQHSSAIESTTRTSERIIG